MTRQELIEKFTQNHLELIDYVNTLPNDAFMVSNNGKWTAGQQLSHVYLTLLPFPKVLVSKDYILQKFGNITRSQWSYDTVIENYLKTSRKAPERYLPEPVEIEHKIEVVTNLQSILPTIQQLLANYTEDELDSLVLPHPLLDKMTIRELFYLMTFHATHHLKQIKQNLIPYYEGTHK